MASKPKNVKNFATHNLNVTGTPTPTVLNDAWHLGMTFLSYKLLDCQGLLLHKAGDKAGNRASSSPTPNTGELSSLMRTPFILHTTNFHTIYSQHLLRFD